MAFIQGFPWNWAGTGNKPYDPAAVPASYNPEVGPVNMNSYVPAFSASSYSPPPASGGGPVGYPIAG